MDNYLERHITTSAATTSACVVRVKPLKITTSFVFFESLLVHKSRGKNQKILRRTTPDAAAEKASARPSRG